MILFASQTVGEPDAEEDRRNRSDRPANGQIIHLESVLYQKLQHRLSIKGFGW